MQQPHEHQPDQPKPHDCEHEPPPPPPSEPPLLNDDSDTSLSIIDVSGKSMDLSLYNGPLPDMAAADGLYIYKNVFNLVPRSLGSLGTRLKTLKFFANEINLFPPEFRDCFELQCLQIKVASPGLTGLPFTKLKALKELELSKAPTRPSGFPILAEIAALKSLTKLSVCHFSIRYLPPEIGCLSNLEYLDLSFNKMRRLPSEIISLSALISLKVANNKLVELPSGLSSLQRLENLDLSRNRLSSLGLLDLSSMQNLQKLNLQYNKLLSCHVPAWICCNLEHNDIDTCCDDLISPAIEMDVLEATVDEDENISCDVTYNSQSYHLPGSSLSDRFPKRRLGKRWKRPKNVHRACLERSNDIRKLKRDHQGDILAVKSVGKCGNCKEVVTATESPSGPVSGLSCIEDPIKLSTGGSDDAGSSIAVAKDDGNGDGMKSTGGLEFEDCDCSVTVTVADSDEIGNDTTHGCDDSVTEASLICIPDSVGKDEDSTCSKATNSSPKHKRQSDGLLDSPKPRKTRRSTDNRSDVSRKYNIASFCGTEDYLPDGFYDAGRDRPFMSLEEYEQNLEFHAREVILLDRERDEELDAISLSAQAMVFRLKKLYGARPRKDLSTDDNFLVASWLALFVSDRLGGSDKGSFVESVRKDVSGSNYQKPFVCTCATGNSLNKMESYKSLHPIAEVDIRDICEKLLQTIKAKRNSVVVPIGSLQIGVCRHRAILLKYLCDRMEPPVPCELIRGYLDFFPHAWNVILARSGGSWVRMIVDACRPHDIREEMDPEYFCRYIPLSRITSPILGSNIPGSNSCFPTMSECKEVEKVASSSLILCKLGSGEAAAKVRSLEVSATDSDAIKKFECTCLGEIRMLGALRNHPCIVEFYGHRISSEWVAASGEKPDRRMLRSAILMEYVRGGSLKGYIQKQLKTGKKHVPVHLALWIARDVAYALKELHSKDIIHRDVKSENVLIDLEHKRADGSPLVKLSDFDSAVPLRAPLHSCCISHLGIPPPDVCVGTPRWMAPEVLQAMDEPKSYGLGIDIWSYGCLLLEMLTLQVPYMGLTDSEIHDLLVNGKRPPLTDELELLWLSDESSRSKTSIKFQGPDNDLECLRFLVDVFHKCTNENPDERPIAADIYDMLVARLDLSN